MPQDEDLSRLLPQSPQPAPARREAAIAEALRRFDGAGRPPKAPAARPAKAPSWWTGINRPVAGAVAAAAVAVLIALPLAVSTMPEVTPGDPPAAPPPQVRPDAASAPVAQREPAPTGARTTEGQRTALPSAASGDDGAQASSVPETTSLQPGAPRARAAGQEPQAAGRTPPLATADATDAEDAAITVTGARIARPDLTSTTPITVVGEEELSEDASVIVTGVRAETARGDWNACTIRDPARDPAACRALINPAARGRRGRAAVLLAEGLASAWRGEHAAAVEAFTRAISLQPRSSLAYLNRALAWQAEGELDRALADLDRAVRYDRRAARGYYHRSLLLRERGDVRRACADRNRAVRLDARYADLFRSASFPTCPRR